MYNIRNIVFDLGGVLIDYNPKKYLKMLGFNEIDINIFSNIVFYSNEWNDYNSSKITLNELYNLLILKYPQYVEPLKLIFSNIEWKYILYEKKEVSDYLKYLQSQGFNIYILSDLSEEHYNFNRQFDFFNYVDGGVYSFEVGSLKPNLVNYQVLLDRYSLIPEETIFIDDRYNNVLASKLIGIYGIQFDSLDSLKENVRNLIYKKA